MMENGEKIGGIGYRSYDRVEAKRQEILRYAGVRSGDPAVTETVDALLAEAEEGFSCRVVYRMYPIRACGGELDLGFVRTGSRGIARLLDGCGGVLLFAATVGFGIDRLLEKYQRLSPAKAVLVHAIGTDRIENLCDRFCADMGAELSAGGRRLTRRFSPGYGDLPLAVQREVMTVLDCERRAGIFLNDSLLMSPAKSVTALCGIGDLC